MKPGEATGAEPVIAAHALYRFYHVGDDETVALRDVSFSVRAGESVAITGPSGSGKSTLIACITGLDEPDGGHVMLDGQRLTRRPEAERARLRARQIGLLRQSGNLIAHLSLEANLQLQARLAGLSDPRHVEQVIDRLNLGDRRRHLPAALSGGEAVRAGLAVALVASPPILIADEPTAGADADTEDRIIDLLATNRTSGMAVVVATHSERLAGSADRVLRLDDGRLRHG